MPSLKHILAFIILSISLALCGFFPGYYYYITKFDNNTITVKGLAEIDVTANLAIWKLKFITTDNNLQSAEQKIKEQATEIYSFLTTEGFTPTEIKFSHIDTQDLLATPYRNAEINSSRFILSQTITIKTKNISLVEQSIPKTDKLIAKGIIFDNSYGDNVSYIFTKLNEIKPQMLEIATKNAKLSAEEFAKSSNSKIGKIHYANQGVFTIMPRDNTPSSYELGQIEKKIRVVTTITYWLK